MRWFCERSMRSNCLNRSARRNSWDVISLERSQTGVARSGRGIRRRGCAWCWRCASGPQPTPPSSAGEEWTQVERGGGVGMGRIEGLEVVHDVAGQVELVLLDAHHDALGELVAAVRGGVGAIGEKLACVGAGGLI